jgi:hypothetical protein
VTEDKNPCWKESKLSMKCLGQGLEANWLKYFNTVISLYR